MDVAALYLAGLVFCARGAARHAHNRDPRVLIAMATPWLLMFALLGQMHERYLMWGAVLSAVASGCQCPAERASLCIVDPERGHDFPCHVD